MVLRNCMHHKQTKHKKCNMDIEGRTEGKNGICVVDGLNAEFCFKKNIKRVDRHFNKRTIAKR